MVAGVKGETTFEFYEYSDGETTDGVYNRISYDIAPELEFDQRAEHETELPGGGKQFAITQNGVYSLVSVSYTHLDVYKRQHNTRKGRKKC